VRLRTSPTFRPFTARGRRTIVAILLIFTLFSAVSVTLSIRATSRSKHQASVVQIAARQRTLAEHYINEVLLARDGAPAAPGQTARLLSRSVNVLLDGGTAPAVEGDDDETPVSAVAIPEARAQLEQERRLVGDLTATGRALLAHRPVPRRLTAHEHVDVSDPVKRLRLLAALTSNVSLNTARTMATSTDRNISNLITLQVLLGIAGLLAFLALAWALIVAGRRQTAHFRSLVTSSTDLVLVFGVGGCRYVSDSVTKMLGRPSGELLGHGFWSLVHPEDQVSVEVACSHAEPHELLFRISNKFGEPRHLEAHVTDLRADRHIRGVVLNARDVTERIRLEEELTRQAFHDSLTGLSNRALFRDRLDQALARSLRTRDAFAVLMLDLDNFKQVNDSLGHDAGDLLLQEVSRRFADVIRPSDTLARLGGDEFALLIEDADETAAVALAGRLLERLNELIGIAGRELVIGASVGIVLHPGAAGRSEDLMRHADLAMYAAKEGGGGRSEVFHEDMARAVGELLGLEHELRMALKRGEIKVHYQPEVDVKSRRIVGVEALARWHSPTRGNVPPLRFIPVAEANGLILPLGELVLRLACAQTAQWRREGILPDPFVTWVNLSGVQLSAGGLAELVREVLETAELPATMLGLEVTETAIVAEGAIGERARAELQELRNLGVKIAIDDFGTGVSSLAQLQRFPVDMIKVDRSFTQGVEHDVKNAAIAANLVSLAHALGLVAVAEGVESEGQLASLEEVDYDQVQGYFLGRPVSPDQTGDLLARSAAGPLEPSDSQGPTTPAARSVRSPRASV
jgi:diguanylate cyclase (GGDEF)-like protein/PAS domain S-box-containing protein